MGPLTAVMAAEYAMDQGWGLLSLLPFSLPFYLELILGIILLDLLIYLQHVACHYVPVLWRFHKVHHADRDLDVTTGVRFHPVEAILSMLYKCAVIALLGPIALSVVIFEIVLNASAMFNHANVAIPKKIDTFLRWFIITPDVHRIHHSTNVAETNSNYGFFLSIWDRIGKTYKSQPEAGHDDMVIGLSSYQTQNPSKIIWCLTLPFKKIIRGKA